ncbi:MAG: PorV/PorQ family protein [Ignavibacteriae bacterium]|nr:PorV/PorQ family protein [Ignavibacteriota bacterium]
MHFRSITLILVALLNFVVRDEMYGQAGKAGLSFLKLGISGRGISMGDAMSAHVTGAAATHYNPAGVLVGTTPAQLMIMHKEWIQDTRTEFLGASARLGETDAIGISLNSTTVSDIEIRTRPGTPEGTFTARNYSLGASYARQFSDDLQIGITAKFLHEKILIDEASGFGFDVGVQYKTTISNLSIGVVVSNLGSMSALRNVKTKLPTLTRIGSAYSTDIEEISSQLTVATDFLHIFPGARSYLNSGAELVFDNIVAARAGYQFGSKGRGFTAGVGVQHGIIALDYAYSPLSLDLGNSHTVSVSLNL